MMATDTVKKALFSERVSGGGRTYFFDVKEAKNGAKYFTITEAKKKEDGMERKNIMIFDNSLHAFVEALQKTVQFMEGK